MEQNNRIFYGTTFHIQVLWERMTFLASCGLRPAGILLIFLFLRYTKIFGWGDNILIFVGFSCNYKLGFFYQNAIGEYLVLRYCTSSFSALNNISFPIEKIISTSSNLLLSLKVQSNGSLIAIFSVAQIFDNFMIIW